jgi:hypothetical protein
MLKKAPKKMNVLAMYCPDGKLPERHMLLKLTDIFEKKKGFLKDPPPQKDEMGRDIK